MMKLKDKKIEILAVTNTINENGYAFESLQPICPTVWAYYRQLSGKEYYSANAEQVHEECLFQINYRADLPTRHVIRYKGALYDITNPRG
jgi:SPP1 family predicted phage head-tail adaptor